MDQIKQPSRAMRFSLIGALTGVIVGMIGGCVSILGRPCPINELDDGQILLGAWHVVKLGEKDAAMQILHVGPSSHEQPDSSADSAGNLVCIFVGPIDKNKPIGGVFAEAGMFSANGARYMQYRILACDTDNERKTNSKKAKVFGLCRIESDSKSKDKLNLWVPNADRISASGNKGHLVAVPTKNGLFPEISIDLQGKSLKERLERLGPQLIFDEQPTHELRRITR